MKIEIDAQDLFELKQDLERCKRELRDTENEMRKLEPEHVQKEIKRQAYALFESYITAIFKKLGFKDSYRVIDFDSYFWMQAKDGDWSQIENLEANLGARIEKSFRAAYLRIGIKLPKE